ncbi:hypothetical protein [Arthrobacter monumenti]
MMAPRRHPVEVLLCLGLAAAIILAGIVASTHEENHRPEAPGIEGQP